MLKLHYHLVRMTNVSRWDKCQLIKVKKGGVQRWLIISQLFNFFPTCRCFLAKEKEALGVWWEKQSDVPVKKKNDISEYKEVVHSNLSSKKCRKTLERPWEHMFKWVIHETFHNRNGCQTIKYASVSYLFFFLRACTAALWRVRITCYFGSFPDL